ncbi:hypothetical protein Tco_1230272 [Tanacetum coccineum]
MLRFRDSDTPEKQIAAKFRYSVLSRCLCPLSDFTIIITTRPVPFPGTLSSEDAEDEGPTAEDEDPAARDEGLAAGDEGPDIRVESLSLGGMRLYLREIALEEVRIPSIFEVGHSSGSVLEPERPERVSALRQPTLTTWIDLEDGIAYIDVLAYPPPAPHVQTPPSLEWSFGSLHVSPAPSIIPSPISSPMIPLTVPSQ